MARRLISKLTRSLTAEWTPRLRRALPRRRARPSVPVPRPALHLPGAGRDRALILLRRPPTPRRCQRVAGGVPPRIRVRGRDARAPREGEVHEDAQGQDRHGHGCCGGDRGSRRRRFRRGRHARGAGARTGQTGRQPRRRTAGQPAAREDDHRREAAAGAAALRRPDERRRPRQPGGQGRRRRGVQPRRPPAHQRAAAHRRRAVAARHPDPVRLRHDPRLPHDLPDPAGDRQLVRSRGRLRGPPVRRARVGRGRPQADLQPDGRRLARAALGPHLRGRRRGPVPELRHGRRAREGRAGPRLLGQGQRTTARCCRWTRARRPP